MLNTTSDENNDELNRETDDENMEDAGTGKDDGCAQVRNIRDPGQPTANEHQEDMTTHRPYRSWCKFCVMGRGVNAPHTRSDGQDDLDGVPHVPMDYVFFGKKESEKHVFPVLVILERRHKMTWAKDTIELCSGVTTRQRLNRWREIGQARQKGTQTVPESPPVGESQSNGIIGRAVGLVAEPDAKILCWLGVWCAPDEQVRHRT